MSPLFKITVIWLIVHIISFPIDANLFDKNKVKQGCFQFLTLHAEKHSSSFELRFHSVHVSETTEIDTVSDRDCPFGMILSSLPGVVNIPRQILDVSSLIRNSFISAPRQLSRSTPSFCQNIWVEHVGQTIFKNWTILSAIFVNGSHFAVSNCIVRIEEEI